MARAAPALLIQSYKPLNWDNHSRGQSLLLCPTGAVLCGTSCVSPKSQHLSSTPGQPSTPVPTQPHPGQSTSAFLGAGSGPAAAAMRGKALRGD